MPYENCTAHVSVFKDDIRNKNTSSDFDPMEGGLDAIMQACVCPVCFSLVCITTYRASVKRHYVLLPKTPVTPELCSHGDATAFKKNAER